MPKHVQNFGISDKWLLSIFALNRKDAQTGKIRQIYGYEIDKNFAAGVYDGKYGQIVVQTMIFSCKCLKSLTIKHMMLQIGILLIEFGRFIDKTVWSHCC